MADSAEEERQKLSDRLEEWAALGRAVPKLRRATESRKIQPWTCRCGNPFGGGTHSSQFDCKLPE